MSACTCDVRSPNPVEHDGIELYRCIHCPECGAVGSYQGAGSTTVNNWTGRSYSVYYCEECDHRYKVYAPSRMTPSPR